VIDLWAKAEDAAGKARLLLSKGHPDGATSRAYYAVFTAARSILVERLLIEPSEIRRHSAVLRLFSEHLVQSGLVPRGMGRRFALLAEERAEADYGTKSRDLEQAKAALEFMDSFLAAIEKLRSEPQP
jgi:uncharacterized protein (UPF0332 family)